MAEIENKADKPKGARRKKEEKPKINKFKLIRNIIITILSLGLVLFIIKIAPNYQKDKFEDKVKLIINNNNVTSKLKKDMVIKDDVIYLSLKDIANYFDSNAYYDEKYDQIITSYDTKLAAMPLADTTVTINGTTTDIFAKPFKQDSEYYLPISEMSKIYNMEIEYIKDTKTLVIDSIDRKLVKASSFDKMSVKYTASTFSKTLYKLEKGESVVVVQNAKGENNEVKGWTQVRTKNGKIGYVKTNKLTNEIKIRDTLEIDNRLDGKVSLIWDYYSQYAKAPDRSSSKLTGVNVVSPAFFEMKKDGKGQISENISAEGKNYVKWAHDNGYKVWPMVSNSSLSGPSETSEMLRDYKTREKIINQIINKLVEYDLDGVNMDFENMKAEDKDYYSRLIIELSPRLKDLGLTLSVDVTAPDGSETWSLCFDRNTIAKVSDYIVFMAYDQNGTSSKKAGTVAGYNWVETNIKKFTGQEAVSSEKIILGIPFYTRMWKTTDEKLTSNTVNMKDIDKSIPDGVEKSWDDTLKQNYIEYEKDGTIYQMWIEDRASIKEKLGLIERYNLAGAGFWEKDREDPDVWKDVSESLGIK